MDEQDIIRLIQKQEEQTITATEYQQLKKWFDESADNQKTYRDYCVIYQGLKIEADKQRFERSKSAVWNRIKHRINPFSEQTQASHKIYALLRYAAIIIFALMIGGFVGHYLYQYHSTSKNIVSIYSPTGSKSFVTLPDGSQVWLNSGSSIAYYGDFGKKERHVTINGEGYFSVTKDKEHPFIVTSEGTSIKVLGTKFDMKAYKGDPCKRITLVEGSLCVSHQGEERIIKPNQQALILDKGIHIKDVPAKEYSSWIKEARPEQNLVATAHDKQLPSMIVPTQQSRTSLLFDNEPLSQIVKDLGRTFNVKILIEGNIADEVFYGDFRNGENLYQILDIISLTGDMKYKIQQGCVTIYK